MALIKLNTGGIDNSVNLGRRNLIINGAMQVAQRGTSFTSLTGDGGYSLDRFQCAGNSDETFSLEQVSDAPEGFSYSYKYTCTTADPTNDSGDYRSIVYQMEGQDNQHLQYSTANAKSLTLSFWVKSNTVGTYSVNFFTGRIRGVEYTINTANTWEYKEITVEGDTGGSPLANDNTAGIRLYWQLGAGSQYTGGVASSWAAYSNSNWASSTGANLYMTLNATWQITGVQLEVGDTATPFEHRSFGEELSLCQRYYYKIGDNMPSDASTDEVYFPFPCVARGTNAVSLFVLLPVSMRIAPQALEWSGTVGDYKWLKAGTYGVVNTGSFGYGGGTSNQSARIDVSLSSAIFSASGESALLRSVTKDAYFAWSAEL